jgi:oligopeptidase A
MYYSQKIQLKKYNFNEEKYKKYFESSNVVNGLFLLLNKLFDIKFKKVKCNTWHKKVQVYDVYDNGKIKARLYMDLETRKNKQGGAWMNNWQSYYNYDDKNKSLASAFLICNFAPSNKKTPSLLKHNDVVTLFHEMGHAIHHIMSNTKEVELSGVNGVAWDVVEFPSQFLELFAYEKKVLSLFAKNYKNNNKLSSKNMDKLINNKNFNSSLAMLRQLEFGLFDMAIHTTKNATKKSVQNTLDNIRKQTSTISVPKYNKFQNSFSHIFGGGYASGYYSYKYAEILSADLFMEFKKQGIFNKKLANRYKNEVLAKGSSENMNELFQKVVKRKLNNKSILKINNIIS